MITDSGSTRLRPLVPVQGKSAMEPGGCNIPAGQSPPADAARHGCLANRPDDPISAYGSSFQRRGDRTSHY